MEELRQVAAHRIDPGRYRSYHVRFWRESPDGPWRCQVSRLGTSLERRFAGLAELFDFFLADVEGGEGESGPQAGVPGEEEQAEASR